MPDRTIAPPFNRSTSFDLIHPEKIVLAKGAEVYFVLGGTQDVSKVELLFPAGRWFEKIWGASYFASQLLTKGTKTKNSYLIAQLFDRYGAHLEVNAGFDHVSVSLYSLNKNLEPSLTLLLELLRESVFPEKELEQLKSIYLQNLSVNREKTSYQASTLFRKTLYGENHPYGKELEDADVKSLLQQQLVDHYTRCFNGCTILVSGNVTAHHQRLITETFAPFLLYSLQDKHDNPTDASKKTDRRVVEKAGSVQSSIRMGKKCIGRADADYADVSFLIHILGGYFGSRLMKNIREEKGLTYGISAALHTMINSNYVVIGADVNRENLNITFDEIRKELKRLRTEKIGEEELETARNHFIGSLQLEITTSFAHADKIKNILLFDLPDNFYQRMIARVDELTPEDLLTVAETYFSEDSFVEVAVG
jgi:zinc protease